MIAFLVRFDIRDQRSARLFDALTAEAVEQISAHEPGTLVYATHLIKGEPLARLFYEVYADEAAFQAHEQAQHVIDFHARKNRLLASQPRVELCTPGPAKGAPVA